MNDIPRTVAHKVMKHSGTFLTVYTMDVIEEEVAMALVPLVNELAELKVVLSAANRVLDAIQNK